MNKFAAWAPGAGVFLASVFAVTAALAQSAGPFAHLPGTWSGSGQIRLDGGKTEALKCKAYYTDKDKGAGLGMALRCASASSAIDLRANLVASGGTVTGNWEERQFNASGNVSGQLSGQRLNLRIDGGGFTGSMAVTTSGGSQTVAITTEGVTFKGATIALNRD